MITPSFSPTATERILPTLALDFTTAILDSRISFTRTTSASSPATYVNSSGYVMFATNDQPRFDYDPITLVCKGLLVEESRANLFLQSQFVSGWTTNAAGSFTGTGTSPDNTSNAKAFNDNSASAAAYTYQGVNVTNAVVYTLSVYVRPINWTTFYVTNFTQAGAIQFTLTGAGIISATASGTFSGGSITAVGNGWYRCTVKYTASGTATVNIGFSTNDNTFTGDAWYIWGAQLEVGAFATSYIPTTTTSLTRNIDAAVMTGTNFSNWYNQIEGTFAVEFQTLNGVPATNGRYVSANDGTASNTVQLYGTSSAGLSIAVGGAGQTLPTTIALAGDIYNINKLIGTYKASSAAIALNGATPNTSSPTSVPSTLTQMNIGNQADGTRQYNGWLRKIRYWKQRIINAETQAFSK